jgi:hypothetical protein
MFARLEGEGTMRECRGNVSVGGFCFEAERACEPGMLAEVLFRLPGAGVWLKGRGVVLGCVQREKSVGVRGRFVAIDLGDTGLLEHWLDSIHSLYAAESDDDESREELQEDPQEITLYSTTIG